MAKKKTKAAKKTVDDNEKMTDHITALIDKQIEEVDEKKLDSKEKEMVSQALKECFIEGKEPLSAMGLPEIFPKLLYKRAYDLYNLGVYEEANGIMRVLCLLEPMSARYQLALAATNHQLGNFEAAVPIYVVSYVLDRGSPVPWFYIYDCYMSLNQPGAAHFALRMATEVCGKRAELQKFKMKCYRMMNKLNEDYNIIDEKAPETEVTTSKESPEDGGVEDDEFDVFEELKSKALEEPDEL